MIYNLTNFSKGSRHVEFYVQHLQLNRDYLVTIGLGQNQSKGICRLVQTSPKGFNFLHLETGKCLFSTALNTYMRKEPSRNGGVAFMFAKELISIKEHDCSHNQWLDGYNVVETPDSGIIENVKKIKGFAKILYLKTQHDYEDEKAKFDFSTTKDGPIIVDWNQKQFLTTWDKEKNALKIVDHVISTHREKLWNWYDKMKKIPKKELGVQHLPYLVERTDETGILMNCQPFFDDINETLNSDIYFVFDYYKIEKPI